MASIRLLEKIRVRRFFLSVSASLFDLLGEIRSAPSGCLTESPGNIIFGAFFRRIAEDSLGSIEFHQPAQIKECSHVGATRRLLHVVGYDDNRKLLFQIIN